MSCSHGLRSPSIILDHWALRQSWYCSHLSPFCRSWSSNIVIGVVLDQKNTATCGSPANLKCLRRVRACSFFAFTKDIELMLVTGAFTITCALSCRIGMRWTRCNLNLRLFILAYTRFAIIASFVEPILTSEVGLINRRFTSGSLEIQRARGASISFDWLW